MSFETIESAMTSALYAALGQAVSYVGQEDDTASIYAIVGNGSQPFGFDSTTSEDVATARVKISDVATPRRGDRIEMADGTVYVVDTVDRLNNVEWEVSLTERDR